jgi:hypothetical protein
MIARQWGQEVVFSRPYLSTDGDSCRQKHHTTKNDTDNQGRKNKHLLLQFSSGRRFPTSKAIERPTLAPEKLEASHWQKPALSPR